MKSPWPQSAVSSHHTGALGSCCCCCWTLRGWRLYLERAVLVVVVVGPFVDGGTILRGLCLLCLSLFWTRSAVSSKSPGELVCVRCCGTSLRTTARFATWRRLCLWLLFCVVNTGSPNHLSKNDGVELVTKMTQETQSFPNLVQADPRGVAPFPLQRAAA